MQVSKNILQGILFGLSTVGVAATYSEATAQSIKQVPQKKQQPKDTSRKVDCVKFDPKLSPEYRPYAAPGNQVSAPLTDSTDLIYKEPCVTCGRG